MRKLLLAVALAACGGPEPVTYYAPPLPAPPEATPRDAVLAVRPFKLAPTYDGLRLTYRTGPATFGRYATREWAADPGVLFADLAARRLESHYRLVHGPASRAPADATLTGTLRVLEVDETGPRPTARLVLDVELTRGEGNRRSRHELTAPAPDLDAALAALGPAYAELIDDLRPEIDATLALPAPDVLTPVEDPPPE